MELPPTVVSPTGISYFVRCLLLLFSKFLGVQVGAIWQVKGTIRRDMVPSETHLKNFTYLTLASRCSCLNAAVERKRHQSSPKLA